MKIRLVLENDYGYDHSTSVELNVECIPRVGETIWIDNSILVHKALSIINWNNCLLYCDGMSINDEDILTVARIKHDYTESDKGIYLILVYNYTEYLKDNN